MAHAFGSPSFSVNPYRSAPEFEGSSNFGTNRVFLVAIHGGVLAPHERNPMQRMRVVVLPANQPSEFNSSEFLPGLLQQPLPPMAPALPMAQQKRLQPRPVRGEILRDPEGRLYEKIGEQIRPLNKLVSGSGGQVLELVRSRGAVSKTHPTVENNAPVDSQKAQDANPPGGPRRQPNGEFGRAGPTTRPAGETLALYRKLFPDPGQRRVIRLGDFKSVLAPQLAHPERLRDTHRLACYLQVYEVATAQRLESFAAAILGDAGSAKQLQPVTESLAYQLGLTPLLRNRPHALSNVPREAGLLLPYERVFRLQVAQDPTADDVVPEEEQPAINLPPRESPASHQPPPVSASGRDLKTAIPERYIKPWEFKSTRDEALYDMNVRAAFAGWFSSLTGWLRRWTKGRRELKKWQFLLNGKSPDDQLWAIPPPKGGVSYRSIRDWAFRTLETAGYDPRTMLVEWQIFWRRKGF